MLLVRSSDSGDAFSLVETGDLDAAVLACSAALSARPGDVGALHAWGLAEFKRARYPEALSLLERALAIDRSDPFLHNNCGEAHRLLGDLDRAFDCYREALLIDSSNAVLHINLGIVMQARGKTAEAEHFFRNAVQRAPRMARPYIELAEIYREEGDAFKALQCYRQGVDLAPDSIPWQTRLATLLAEQGDTREALSVLRRATTAAKADAPAWYERARLEFELCREAEARTAYCRAAGADPGLSRHGGRRVVAARRTDPRAYCERGAGDCVELARSQWLRLPPPSSIPAEASQLWAVGDMVDPFTSEILLLRLRDVEVMPRDFSVLAEGRHALIDGLVNWAQHYGQRGRHAVHQSDDGRLLLDLPARAEEAKASCALLGGEGDLYAWMFEGVARLWGLEQRAQAANLPLVVPDGLAADRLALLEALGIGGERLLPLPEDRTLHCGELWVPTLPVIGDWPSPLAIQFLRRRVAAALPDRGRRARRVFVSREASDTRRLANETELLPLLERHGFEVVQQAHLTLLELLAIFGQAEAILACDDDALACLVVAPQGAQVGAIASKGIYRPRAYCISAQTGQIFTYLQAEPDFSSHADHRDCDVSLPVASLQEWLKRF